MNLFRHFACVSGIAAAVVFLSAPAGAFVTFESGQVRPLAMSPDGSRLFACNTPDNRLEIFDIALDGSLTHVTSVPVGLEPVAVAARTDDEVWVVNHLSDSVSIVDISDIDAPRVTRSLTVGDEPRDIVFGGALFDRAFITTAHRGQNVPYDPQFTTEGIGRADVWVFDANNLGASFGGDELTILQLFGDTPRPLAVSPNGERVYAGVFFSGNQTTCLGEGHVPNGGEGAGGLPGPNTDHTGDPQPEVGLIVKYNGAQWVDELGTDRSFFVRFNLPDFDVFAIDATANPPIQLAGTPGRFPGVGTTLFNMAVNPSSGKLYVSNLEAFNEVRFEGPGTFADSTVRGHLVESRITVIDPVAETVTPIHLNKHIDYNSPFDPPGETNSKSLAFPLDMQLSSDGSTLYVAGLGSSKVGIYDTAELESDTFVPAVEDQLAVTGGGPTGLVLNEAASRLYVLTRFDNSVSVVSTATGDESQHLALHNPEPESVVAGRPFLYDASLTSSRGDQACASCHIFGDFDGLAWDLGNPDEEEVENPLEFILGPILIDEDFHPMKGPMTTQSLRGMDNHGAMHWRGDRFGTTGGNVQPNGGTFNEEHAFMAFNPAFVGLIGRHAELSTAEMQSFTDFILQVMYPPNPVRNLDNSLTADQAAAQTVYFNRTIDTVTTCNGCHVFNRDGNGLGPNAVERPGFFGSDGRATFENEPQMFKVAHLRNLYQKVGMFGMASEPFVNPGDNAHKGDQVRGFGFLHDGSIDTVFRFFQATVFNHSPGGPGMFPNGGFTVDAAGDIERRQMESLMLAFDSNHRPIVGQQSTISPTSGVDADTRVDLILDRADAGECDAVVKGIVAGESRGYLYEGAGQFSSDRAADGLIAEATLRAHADTAGQELTFTAVPTGEGERIAIDRDLDGYGDIDEIDGGGDPADAASLPCVTTTPAFVFKKALLKESRGRLQITAEVPLTSPYSFGSLEVEASDGDGVIFAGGLAGSSFEINNSGSTWSFKAPKDSTGIVRAKVKAGKTPGTYRVTLKTDAAWTPPAADETELSTNVVLQIVDECFDGPATKVKP